MSSVTSQQTAGVSREEDVAYTEFVFRVYPDGRRQRFTQIYITDEAGRARLLEVTPRGAVAQAALEAVTEVQQEMRSGKRTRRR